MSTILITGATSFLGYHVAKRLNQAGIRPRVLERPESKLEALDRADVERCPGHLDDPAAVRSACTGADTLLHVAFKVNIAGGPEALAEMQRVNVEGTRELLKTAAAAGVRRAVVAGSALAVGVNREAAPLDETADWSQHAFDLPYATLRRQVELEALAQTTPEFAVMTVCPSFTFGPDDPSGAPANKLVGALIAGKIPCKVAVGFGCLDVRDFANGMVLAGERGRPQQRYLLSGENITTDKLVDTIAAISGVPGPRFTAPAFVVKGLVGALGAMNDVLGKESKITNDVLQILGRYAWYNTTKARTELGWTSRTLHETLNDTIQWLRQQKPAVVVETART
jgi:dihydroflavonol-4-reductase